MFRLLFASFSLGLLCVSVCPGSQPPRPNILYFYVDDMGWGSIGPNGQSARRANGLPSVKTPNLDELARRGMNFTRGYGCFVCSPARSSQQTGFHQGHTFADRNDPDNAKKAIRSDDVTMGDALLAAGYTTGYWGKWGYGGSKDQDDPVIQNVQTLPTSHGYQHVLAELHHVRAHTFFQPTLWHAPAKPGSKGGVELVANSMAAYQDNAGYPNHPALQNHPSYPSTGYCDDAYAMATLDFVREQGQEYNRTGKPFFGLLAVQIPHGPFEDIIKLPEWDAAYKDDKHFHKLPQQSQQWAAMVTRIDSHFGNIISALEDPNQDGDNSDSIVKNTLVIFQSDNGGPNGSNNKSFDSNGGLSGSKGRIEEGGIRVPLIMRWPGRIDAGSTNDSAVDVTDLLPTFCDLAGVPSPLGIDGISLAPTLTGVGVQQQREFLIHEAGNGNSIIRGNHKLVKAVVYKKKQRKMGATKLYDLAKDRAETNDIAAQNPQLTEELLALLMGERVFEPKGFAVSYHNWQGDNGAVMSDADNWSDYEYANDGISYSKDAGAPQLSWIARLFNDSEKPNEAVVNDDLSFLALEISGKNRRQSLLVPTERTLTARNELRIGSNGTLKLQGASIETQRRVSVVESGLLVGYGSVKGDLANAAEVRAETKSLQIDGDYLCAENSTTVIGMDANVTVGGTATIGGDLIVKRKTPGPILTAKEIDGKFQTVKLPSGFRLVQADGSISIARSP